MPVEVKRRKIAVLGARSVGKSSLVKQFVEKQFIDSYYPTIERAYVKNISYKGNEYVLEIFDTAGQDEFSPLKAQYAIGIHGYVLVYSIASTDSFEMVQILRDKILDYCGVTDIPCVIVGAKSDLHSSRQVQLSELEKLAEANNAACVMSTLDVFSNYVSKRSSDVCPAIKLLHKLIDASCNNGTTATNSWRIIKCFNQGNSYLILVRIHS